MKSSMDWNEFFFRHVFLAASKSKDNSSKVGAILVKGGTVISEGYNGFPRSVHDNEKRIEDRPTKLIYTVHAEHNSILNCARNGISTIDSVMYTTAFPCDQCMKCIIQAGIKHVFCHAAAQDFFYKRNTITNWNEIHKHSKIMAREAGVKIHFWEGKLNIETLIGGKLVIV